MQHKIVGLASYFVCVLTCLGRQRSLAPGSSGSKNVYALQQLTQTGTVNKSSHLLLPDCVP